MKEGLEAEQNLSSNSCFKRHRGKFFSRKSPPADLTFLCPSWLSQLSCFSTDKTRAAPAASLKGLVSNWGKQF